MCTPDPVSPSGSNTAVSYPSSASPTEKIRRRNRLSLSSSAAKELFPRSSEDKSSATIIEALQLEAPSKKREVKAIYHTISGLPPVPTLETDQLSTSSKSSDIVTVSELVHHVSMTSPRSKFPNEIDIEESGKSGPPKKPSPRDLINSLFNRRKEEKVLDFSQSSHSDWQSYKTSAGWGKKKKEIKKRELPRKNSNEADRPTDSSRKTSEVKTLNLKKLTIGQDDFHFINYYL